MSPAAAEDRLADCFACCKQEERAALVGYLTAGDPDPDTSGTLLRTLAEQCDIIEIGMPFSDPMADGPLIQAASERALASGTHMEDVFRLSSQVRQNCPDVGIILMGYANVAFAMGVEAFAEKAKIVGADGVLLVDVPPEEAGAFDAPLKKQGLHSIRLLAPTSSDQRVKLAAQSASGFIYYVSLAGITGAKMGDIFQLKAEVENVRQYTDLPICVGFGIKTTDQARAVAAFSDGIVVGSHFVAQIAEHLSDSCAMIKAVKNASGKFRSTLQAGRLA